MPDARVLVVEDESIIGYEIQTRLRRLGYVVLGVVPSGEEAVSLAMDMQPDLVLMDIVLRGEMDGIEAANQIRAKLDVPVIFLTAHDDEQTLQRAKVSQPFGYIVKPFKVRDLYIAIEIGLYKHNIEQQLRQSEERLRMLVESTEDIVTVQDLTGRFLYFHGASKYGLTPDMVVGKMPADILDPESAADLMDKVAYVAETGQSKTIEANVSWNGAKIWFNTHAYPLRDNSGKINAVAIMARNITEIKRLRGLLPICAWCGKKIQNEDGQWQSLDIYIMNHSEARVTHSICDGCLEKAQAELEV